MRNGGRDSAGSDWEFSDRGMGLGNGLTAAELWTKSNSMASKSRAAQENLAELEKLSAPFEDQLEEAANFVGVDLNTIGRCTKNAGEGRILLKSVIYHGREEWLLKWLLKRMQASGDIEPRNTPLSWRLLYYLLQVLPLTNAARALADRLFTSIVRQTLEEAQKASSDESIAEASSTFASDSEEVGMPQKSSKKRKHTGELVGKPSSRSSQYLLDLLGAIVSVVALIIQSTQYVTDISEERNTSAFSTEYMKTVVRTGAKDAATILGSWLSLCEMALKGKGFDENYVQNWLSPFIEIWNTHTAEDNPFMQFSLHCTQPVLSLLRAVQEGQYPKVDWVPQLEQLISRNIMNPAKAAKWENPESDLLSTLTKISVLQNTANTPRLFEVAIRSIQPHGSRRRRGNDDTWLQTVFKTLKDAMPPQKVESNGKHIGAMLQCAIGHRLSLDLSDLRAITSEYALPKGREDWELLATIIKLDANVFLIPNDEQDLLKELLDRITKASIEPSWPELSAQIVLDVLVPLMSEFAKARDLSGFLRHWLGQLVEFDRVRKEAMLFSMETFGAWEDDALQAQLSNLLEASLTVQQIIQILDWLLSQVTEHPDAVCVLLEAIAGSIHHEEVVDAIGLRLYHIMFDNGVSDKLDGRYKWRSWRLLCRSLNWIMAPEVEELSQLWEQRAKPFSSLSSGSSSSFLLEMYSGNTVGLNALEIIRFVCAAWEAAGKESSMENLAKPVLLNIFRRLAQDIRCFPQDLKGNTELGNEICDSNQNTLYRGIGWTIWSFVRCVFVEYPNTLELGLELNGNLFRDMLQDIFWVASASVPENYVTSVDWLRLNPNAFPGLWMSILQCEKVLNSEPLVEQVLDIMLRNQSNVNNPLVKSASTNAFAVQSLLQLPLSVVLKKSRERVFRAWLPTGNTTIDEAQGLSCKSTALDPAVLSLKIKFMQRPVLYEGMDFKDLVYLADTLAEAEIPRQHVNLALLKELTRLTFAFLLTNVDQPPQKAYISNAFSMIQKKISKAGEKKKHRLNYALVTIFGAAISAFHARATSLNDLEVIRKEDLDRRTSAFKEGLLAQLKEIFQKFRKGKSRKRKTSQATEHLSIFSIINALSALGADSSKLAELEDDAKAFCASVQGSEVDIGRRLETFMAIHRSNVIGEELLGGDISTVNGRQSIKEKTLASTVGKNKQEKLKLLESIFGPGLVGLTRLDKLLAAQQVIILIEDTRKPTEDEEQQEDSETNIEDGFDLSEAYSILCGNLWKATGVRQFCIISETLELMIRTKGRSMTQFNIDTTLGSITIICSRNGPPLRPSCCGTIYMHLCRLLQSVLTHHRLKLQGHFHLVVQVMQSLLRLLFLPLPHSTNKGLKYFGSPPPWLSSPKHQLNAKHAAAFTRLVTLICDPSVSSVRGAHHNNLTSATDKAKRMAGQHMQFVLTTYIKLQLEMRMLPEIRETIVPGIYAIFDSTTPELRRVINDGLDANGRAVFGTLYRDYARFGKWKGN